MTAEKQRFVDTRQVAEMLDLHPEQIKKLRYRGDGPRWFRVGAAVRYDVLEIGRWIEEQTTITQKGADNAGK